MANRYIKNQPIPLIKQKAALCSAYKGTTCKIDKKRKELFWSGKIRPTAFSKEYSAYVLYKVGTIPTVWIIGDELEKIDSPDFPHNYHVNAEKKAVHICLYRHLEFNSCLTLANTIIPWTVEWLYYYELWLATGEWLGGGEHPDPGKNKSDDENEDAVN